jgi:Cu-processing system permease protein
MGPSGLKRIQAVAANTFRESVRERVLYNLVFFAIVMTLSGLLLRDLSIRQDEKIIKDIGLAAMDLFGTLIALFIGMGLISKELERRSLYPLLAKPLGRTEFLLGKFVGLAFTLAVNVGIMTAGMYLTLVATGGTPDLALLTAVYPIYVSLLLVVCIALLFSTVMSSPILGVVGTLCLVLAGRYSDVIRGMKEVAPRVPDELVSFVYYAIPNFHDFDFKAQVVYGTPVPIGTLAWVTLYAVLYGGLCLSIAATVFSRKDLQ